jgi:hypothetical protein
MRTRNYRLQAIDPVVADALRVAAAPVTTAGEHPGYPCRQCLRDADIGDELVLVSHDPFTTDTPYRSASPIFLHREPCVAPTRSDELPRQLTQRQLSVRSFDSDEMMIDAAVIDGQDLHETIERFFMANESHTIHVHNATRGCWATSVERA